MGMWGRLPHWHWGRSLRAGFVCLKQPLRCIVSLFCCPHGVLVLGLLGPFGEGEVCPYRVGSVVLKQMGLFSPAHVLGESSLLHLLLCGLFCESWCSGETGGQPPHGVRQTSSRAASSMLGEFMFLSWRGCMQSQGENETRRPKTSLFAAVSVLVAACLFYTTGALNLCRFCCCQIPCLGSQA